MSPKELQAVKQRYGIVGNCDALNRALETALKVARVDLSILIQGENGVGKEVLPRIIHDASARKGKKYLALNCGALPEGTIDSELFGHVKAPSREVLAGVRVIFRPLTAARFFSTRSANCPCKHKSACCACSKRGSSSPWDRAK